MRCKKNTGALLLKEENFRYNRHNVRAGVQNQKRADRHPAAFIAADLGDCAVEGISVERARVSAPA